MASVFWDKDRILLVNYLKEGAIITASYYSSLLDKVKKAMHPKGWGKLLQGVLFLQGNASSHTVTITHRKLADLHSEVLKYPIFSPDVAPSDYHLFPNFEKHHKGTKFLTTEDTMPALYDWFAAQPSAFYLGSLEKLEQKSKKCVELMGKYTEQSIRVKSVAHCLSYKANNLSAITHTWN